MKDCKPTICNQDTLMTGEWEFMNRDEIKERCSECIKQEVCIRIVNLLQSHKIDEALDLITYVAMGKGK